MSDLWREYCRYRLSDDKVRFQRAFSILEAFIILGIPQLAGLYAAYIIRGNGWLLGFGIGCVLAAYISNTLDDLARSSTGAPKISKGFEPIFEIGFANIVVMAFIAIGACGLMIAGLSLLFIADWIGIDVPSVYLGLTGIMTLAIEIARDLTLIEWLLIGILIALLLVAHQLKKKRKDSD